MGCRWVKSEQMRNNRHSRIEGILTHNSAHRLRDTRSRSRGPGRHRTPVVVQTSSSFVDTLSDSISYKLERIVVREELPVRHRMRNMGQGKLRQRGRLLLNNTVGHTASYTFALLAS